MEFSRYFGENVKTLDVYLSGYFYEPEFLKIIEKQKVEGLFIHQSLFTKQMKTDLKFLDSIVNKDAIKKIGVHVDFEDEASIERLYNFKNLDSLVVINFTKNNICIDVSRFPKLVALTINGQVDLIGLDKIQLKKLLINENKKIANKSWGKTIEELEITHSKPVILEEFNELSNLKNLELIQSSITSLAGIENFKNLECLTVGYCPKLLDISAISNCTKLRKIEFENTKKITSFNPLTALKNLQGLILSDCGEISSLQFINDLSNLKFLSFVGTNIVDGDLTPCLRLKYAATFNKRHYNIKEDELPKKLGCSFHEL